jgi:hypothetical protein
MSVQVSVFRQGRKINFTQRRKDAKAQRKKENLVSWRLERSGREIKSNE